MEKAGKTYGQHTEKCAEKVMKKEASEKKQIKRSK
jgi:hypothetical protein